MTLATELNDKVVFDRKKVIRGTDTDSSTDELDLVTGIQNVALEMNSLLEQAQEVVTKELSPTFSSDNVAAHTNLLDLLDQPEPMDLRRFGSVVQQLHPAELGLTLGGAVSSTTTDLKPAPTLTSPRVPSATP